jgi:hypothetical protein
MSRQSMSVLQVKNNLRSRRNLVARRQGGELHRAANDERVWSDEEDDVQNLSHN